MSDLATIGVYLALALLSGWYIGAHLIGWWRTRNLRYAGNIGWWLFVLGINGLGGQDSGRLRFPILLLGVLVVMLSTTLLTQQYRPSYKEYASPRGFMLFNRPQPQLKPGDPAAAGLVVPHATSGYPPPTRRANITVIVVMGAIAYVFFFLICPWLIGRGIL